MHLDHPRRVRAGRLVQAVDVLGDQRVEPAGPFELDEGAVTVVGLGRERRRRGARAPGPLPHRRVGEVVREVGGLLGRRVLGPEALRPAEVLDAAVGADARAGEHDDPLGLRQPAPDLLQPLVERVHGARLPTP